MSSKSDIQTPPLSRSQALLGKSTRQQGNRRKEPPAIVSTAVQLNLFQFFEQGYTPIQKQANHSVELNQAFRQQVFREPMRLLQALPKLSVLERRLYWLVLSALKSYQYLQQASSLGQPLLEQRLSFQFHRTRLRATGGKTGLVSISVSEVKKILHDLSTRTIRWENVKGDLVSAHIFDTQYLMGEGMMVLELNPKLTEAFLKLGNDFSQFNLQKAFLLKSEYSQLLFSYFSKHQWRGKWKVGITDFRQLMDVHNTESYGLFTNINRRLIKPAIKEIEALGDMTITYQTTLVKRQVVSILFTITKVTHTVVEDPVAAARLAELLSVNETMSFTEKLSFAAKTIPSYYPGLPAWQQERILSERTLLDSFLRADAYVEAGLVQPNKHEAYVATSVFGRATSPKSPRLQPLLP